MYKPYEVSTKMFQQFLLIQRNITYRQIHITFMKLNKGKMNLQNTK